MVENAQFSTTPQCAEKGFKGDMDDSHLLLFTHDTSYPYEVCVKISRWESSRFGRKSNLKKILLVKMATFQIFPVDKVF